jgi:hypothetical protein
MNTMSSIILCITTILGCVTGAIAAFNMGLWYGPQANMLNAVATFLNLVMCFPCIPKLAKSICMGIACIIGAIPLSASTSSRFGLGDICCIIALLLRAASAVGYGYLYHQEHQEKQQALPFTVTKPAMSVPVPVLAAAVVASDPAASSTTPLEARLQMFYMKHNPSKLQDMQTFVQVVNTYRNNEAALNEALFAAYGATLDTPTAVSSISGHTAINV